MDSSIFLQRVVLNNYKSVKECSVRLGPLTFLVGSNGSGKSNFLDALRLVSEALNTSLEHALRERGGIDEVRRRSSGHPTHFGVRLDCRLSEDLSAVYSFRVGARKGGGFEIQKEECRRFEGAAEVGSYRVEGGSAVLSGQPSAPPASRDRLYLVTAASFPEYRLLYDMLSHMGFYNLNPDAIRELQPPDPGEVLKRDGGNLASMIDSLSKGNGGARDRIVSLLSKVVPGVEDVRFKRLGKKGTLEFRQKIGGSKDPWRFPAENMSDGTLRALGILTALFQSSVDGGKNIPFVGIEEPEIALHPGAAGVLRDSLRAASDVSQVTVTSHSPDLLDDKDISDGEILAVSNRDGETLIGPLDEAGRSAIRKRLYTAGELLRMEQVNPDETEIGRIPPRQLDLFSDLHP